MAISSEAVAAKTGKTLDQWFAILDRRGGAKLPHGEIVALLAADVGPWWRQMVTVEYERARGLRARHQKPSGFEVSASRTIGAPVSALAKAWTDPRRRKRWLSEAVEIRKTTASKAVRGKWTKDETPISVDLFEKGPKKSQITITHGRLPSAAAAERMKKYWRARLDDLQALIEA